MTLGQGRPGKTHRRRDLGMTEGVCDLVERETTRRESGSLQLNPVLNVCQEELYTLFTQESYDLHFPSKLLYRGTSSIRETRYLL